MRVARDSDRSANLRVAVIVTVAAAFLLCHPYTGIRHDGTLYAGEALARLLPGTLRDDIYFKFGSQGRFTLMPALYASVISALGLGAGTMAMMLAAFTAYVAATWYLVSSFVTDVRWRGFCALAVALGWTIYGGNRIFGYSEPFVTARSFAEPVVLLGLGLLVRGRVAAALAALLVAGLLHPLIAAGGCLVAWVWLVRRDRRWYAAALVAIASLAILGAFAVGPFDDVFTIYDARWLALVHEANGHAFVLRWSPLDYGVIVFDAVVLWLVARLHMDGPLRELAIAAAIAGIGATLASLVLVDLVGNPFFGKLQIWRAEWVMQWVAMAALPLLLKSLWQRHGEHGRVAGALLAIGWIAPFTFVPALVAAMAIAIDGARARFAVSRATTRIVCAVAIIVALTVAIQYEGRVVKLGILLNQPPHLIVAQALTMNLIVMAAAIALIAAWPRAGRAAPLLALVVLLASSPFWDQRAGWTRKLESYPVGTHIWTGLIGDHDKVYWYRDLIAPWVLLGHGNYYTQQQGSGAVFSREMVVELDRRRRLTAALDFQEQICRMMNNLSEKQASCEPDVAAVRTLCDEGGIDDVVLESTLKDVEPVADFSTGVVENGYEKKFFLYRCSALNKG